MHKYEGFTMTCDKCGNKDIYLMQKSFYIVLICNNFKECGQEKNVLEIWD